MIDAGENLEMVAQVLGHRDKEATKGYISVSERLLRKCSLDMPQLNRVEVNDESDEV
jgi:site-specific recombinase XerD